LRAVRKERSKELARQRRAERSAYYSPKEAERLARMVKIGQFKRIASKPHQLEYEWNSLIELATRRAGRLIDEIIRPPTELWALREQFLQGILDTATWPEEEIPEIDDAEIEAMFAPKPLVLGEEFNGI
jgi:hypothetical protein